jgi:hypothetical protein
MVLNKMLKQASTKNRAFFLELFTKELILNSSPEESAVKRKAAPSFTEEGGLGGYVASEKLDLPEVHVEQRPKKFVYKTKSLGEKGLVRPKTLVKRPIASKNQGVPKKIIVPMKKPGAKKLTFPLDRKSPDIASTPLLTHELELGRLGLLLSDKEVTVIECPGPDNFLFVKKAGKVHLTRIKLSQEEIDRILDSFSAKARIPLMEGVFKAIVGNLSINAVITDSSGDRFMIYKKTPYSYIEQS